jgi:hypothetical protein
MDILQQIDMFLLCPKGNFWEKYAWKFQNDMTMYKEGNKNKQRMKNKKIMMKHIDAWATTKSSML